MNVFNSNFIRFHRCLIPECDDPSNTEFAPKWILNAVPGTSATSFEGCTRFANASLISPEAIDHTCPATLFDQQRTVDCKKFIYANSESIVYDFGLACDEWRRSLIGTVRTVGTLVAMPLTGFISDQLGRRTALVINAFNTAWIGALRYIANTYIGFLMSEFFEAVFGAGGFTCTYILGMFTNHYIYRNV